MSAKGSKLTTVGAMEDNKTRKRHSRRDKEADKQDKVWCKDCNILIGKDTKALSCNFCHKWLCTSCLEVNDDLYDMLVCNPKSILLVPCKDCSSQLASMQEMRVTLNEVKANQEDTKKQLVNLDAKMSAISKDIKKTVKEVVKAEVDSQLKGKVKEVEKRLGDKIQDLKQELQPLAAPLCKAEIEQIVVETYSEEKQKDIRKSNLMMFNIPELYSKELQDRKKHDLDMVLKVLRALQVVDNIQDKIVSVLRMGRWQNDQTRRPLRIVFSDPNLKYMFIQKAYKIKQSEDELVKNVRLSSDRTPREIEQYKELRAELERRKALGESDLRIRKGKIISLRKEEEEEVLEGVKATEMENAVTDDSVIPSAAVESHDSDREIGFVFSQEHAEGESADGIEGFVSIPIEGSQRFSASPKIHEIVTSNCELHISEPQVSPVRHPVRRNSKQQV